MKELIEKVDRLTGMMEVMMLRMEQMQNARWQNQPPQVPNTASHDYGWLREGYGVKWEPYVAFGDFPLGSFIGGGSLTPPLSEGEGGVV